MIFNKLAVFSSKQNGLSLPTSATTRSGVEFNPMSDHWVYRDGSESISLDFSFVKEISTILLESMKLTLLWYAENMSPSHTRNGFTRIKHLLKTLAEPKWEISEISSVELMNYRSKLNSRTQWYLGSVAGFLKKWNALGIPGVTKDAVAFLNEVRLPGNAKGVAVLTMDPVMGPFTNNEREALQAALNMAYAKGEVGTSDYLLALLFMLLGQRPTQYALLKVCDVREEKYTDGTSIYILSMPRAKQRGELPRSSFRERVLIPQIGALLVEYANSVATHFANKLEDPTQAPLFPETRSRSEKPAGLKFHRTATSTGLKIKAIFESLLAISERTGKPIWISAIRFRRTLGTQAAVEGHGELVIAELLDHTDTQNVRVYVEATPQIVERIDNAVALQLAPLAQAFAGVLTDSNDASESSPYLSIVAPQYSPDFKPFGNCGQHGFCGFAAPIACYTCSNFRAWQDGPHEAILNYLVAERDRLMKTTDARIASVNDRTIFAVAQVVKLCQEAQALECSND